MGGDDWPRPVIGRVGFGLLGEAEGTPHPECFCKRVRNILKTKRRKDEKRGKRV